MQLPSQKSADSISSRFRANTEPSQPIQKLGARPKAGRDRRIGYSSADAHRRPFHHLLATTNLPVRLLKRGQRMIALADCAVAVSNAKAAAKWWVEKVGFAVRTVGSGEHAMMVAPPGDRFILHLCEGFETVQAGNTGIAFVTDDLPNMVRRMEAAGVHFSEPLKIEPWGGRAKFADPDGNVFWLLGAPSSFIRKETSVRAIPRRHAKPRTRAGRAVRKTR